MMQNKFRMGPLQKVYHATFPTYIGMLRKHLQGCETLLELGCGKSSPIGFVKKSGRWVGVDIHKPAIEHSKKLKIHDEYIVQDVLKTGLKAKQYDVVVALDLIEHLEKKDGYKLMAEMERLAKKKVIIFTPNGWLDQKSIDGNDFQEHLSGWSADEMKKHGFDVYGINGWKPIRGARTTIKLRPKPLWQIVSTLSEPLVYKLPKHAFHIFCVKKLDTKK